MARRVTVELVCDARRAPGCHGASAARATVVFEVEKEAQRTGWGKDTRARGRRAPSTATTCAPPAGPGHNRAPTGGPPGRDAGPERSGVPPTACHAPDCDRRAVLVCSRCGALCCPRHAHAAWEAADGVVCVPCLTAPVPMRPRRMQQNDAAGLNATVDNDSGAASEGGAPG